MGKTIRREDRHDDESFWDNHQRHDKHKEVNKDKKSLRKKIQWDGYRSSIDY